MSTTITIRQADTALLPVTLVTGLSVGSITSTGVTAPTRQAVNLDDAIVYFTLTEQWKVKPGQSGVAAALGLSTPTQSGIQRISAADGLARVIIGSGATAALKTGPYNYAIEVTQTGQMGVTGYVTGGYLTGSIEDTNYLFATGVLEITPGFYCPSCY